MSRVSSGRHPETRQTQKDNVLIRLWHWLPSSAGDRRVVVAAWLNLIFQTVLVGTGGAVRLTASGLGCPTWPKCTPESFISTPEMGIHGIIEFGNRTLFFVLQIIAIFALLCVIRYRAQRRDLFVLALIPACSVLFQAGIGGITVLTGLNPYVVGLHFVLSVVLVVLGAVLVMRVTSEPGPRERVVPAWFARLAHVAAFFVAISVIIGILTTGSGPHAGDQGAARNDLPPEVMQHVHSWPAYVMLALTVVLALAAWTRGIRSPRTWLTWLVVVQGVQILIGITQSRLGLPEALVGTHMVLACVLAALMSAVLYFMKRPVKLAEQELAR
ncbi:heme A synthase [Microbacterium sp. MPKO10]|uniref:COX15/CtaA family protein n=1 Tax=Microbacterium sp. MPKO10 TaxID=2989818 RepID=UPI0022362ED1|nr:COX15/CtaA family protein [Microbacterium sp. MPKO10]MCW4459483.1 COX15/CtaA family protein [Microbacterium sp. MPKO10]